MFQSVKTGAAMLDNNILSRHIKPAARKLGLPWINWRSLAHLACGPGWSARCGMFHCCPESPANCGGIQFVISDDRVFPPRKGLWQPTQT